MTSGQCACGAVRYAVDGELDEVINCHCVRCRRVTGHHMAATAAPRLAVTIDGEESLRWWGEDETAEYAFCAVCGSTLFWRALSDPEKLTITAGSIDPPTGLRTTSAWWVATASDYHVRPEGLEEYDYEP